MADDRKYRKPLMEKKRRARINESLDSLKQILLECDPHSVSKKSAKLEKADILEMTVSYLQNLKKPPVQQSYYQPATTYGYYPAQNRYSAQSFSSKNGNGGHVYYGGASTSYSQKSYSQQSYSQQKYGEKEKIWRPW